MVPSVMFFSSRFWNKVTKKPCLDYMLRTSTDKMKDNVFKLTKERSRRYPAQTITDADNADNRKRHQHATSKGMDSYQSPIAHMEVRPDQWNKMQFFPCSGRVDTAVWMHYMDATKTYGEKTWRQLHKNAASNVEQVLEATTNKAATVRPPTNHREKYPS